jgi:hypothetical protein
VAGGAPPERDSAVAPGRAARGRARGPPRQRPPRPDDAGDERPGVADQFLGVREDVGVVVVALTPGGVRGQTGGVGRPSRRLGRHDDGARVVDGRVVGGEGRPDLVGGAAGEPPVGEHGQDVVAAGPVAPLAPVGPVAARNLALGRPLAAAVLDDIVGEGRRREGVREPQFGHARRAVASVDLEALRHGTAWGWRGQLSVVRLARNSRGAERTAAPATASCPRRPSARRTPPPPPTPRRPTAAGSLLAGRRGPIPTRSAALTRASPPVSITCRPGSSLPSVR